MIKDQQTINLNMILKLDDIVYKYIEKISLD